MLENVDEFMGFDHEDDDDDDEEDDDYENYIENKTEQIVEEKRSSDSKKSPQKDPKRTDMDFINPMVMVYSKK